MTEEVKKEEVVEEGEVVEVEEEQASDTEPQEEAEQPEVSEEPEQEVKGEEELEDYSERVKKRISNLTRKLREEERAKESAYNFAMQLQDQNKKLLERSTSLDRSYLSEAENRLKSQRAQATAALKSAHQEQDFDKVAKAQDILSKIAVEESKIQTSRSQLENQDNLPELNNQQIIQNQNFSQSFQNTPAPEPDPKAQAWAEKNTWFGTDETMTLAAFNIHKNLVDGEGFDPTTDEYYNEVDKRMVAEFPHKFENAKKPSQKVASANRADAGTGKKKQIKLSPSEVQMAKKLNVPLNEYAKYVKR
jgi:chromosome segregation ATPase